MFDKQGKLNILHYHIELYFQEFGSFDVLAKLIIHSNCPCSVYRRSTRKFARIKFANGQIRPLLSLGQNPKVITETKTVAPCHWRTLCSCQLLLAIVRSCQSLHVQAATVIPCQLFPNKVKLLIFNAVHYIHLQTYCKT